MIKKLREMSFTVVLIFLIAIGIYWIMDQLQKDYLDQYINILGDKLISMVPESSEKKALSDLFDGFKSKVEKNEVSPEQVERIAADIFNFSYLGDSLTYAEASALIEVPEVVVVPAPRPDEKRWRELGERLETVYRFERKHIPEFEFQVDQNLNILIDEEVREALIARKEDQAILEMEILENNKSVVWIRSLDSSMERMREKMISIRSDLRVPEQERIRELREVMVITADSLQTVVSIQMDSLKIRFEHQREAKPNRPQ